MDPKPTPSPSTPRQRSAPAQYVYCVIRANGASSFGAIGIGDPPKEVRIIKSGDLAAVVSDAPCEVLKPTRQNVLAHERVNDRVMLQRTVVPMSFGNVFKTREGVAALLRSARAPLTEVLERMEGKIELGLKVLWDPEVEKRECAERDQELRRIRAEILSSKGSTYSSRIEYGRTMESLLQARAQALSREILEALKETSIASKVNVPLAETMILNAAFLISKKRKPAFDRRLHALGERRESLTFRLTGPWPPYNFVSVRLSPGNGEDPA